MRRDALRALQGTADAPSHASETFGGPVKIIWGLDDGCLPVEFGERLAATFPDAELRGIRQARLLVPLDQPESVADAVVDILEHRNLARPPFDLS